MASLASQQEMIVAEAESGDWAVHVAGVVKAFGAGEQRVVALRGVDWYVRPGGLSLLVGPSGCGKTTLISVIAGTLDCDEGHVEIFGKVISRMTDRRRTSFRAKNIGFVFQQYNLLPALSAAENAAVPLIIGGWSRAKALDRARAVLDELGLGSRTRSLPTQLSGGQQQRVAIARALVHEPELIVCDEPTAALDHETGMKVMELLHNAAVRPDRAVIVVTHDNRVFEYADHIAHMDDGTIQRVSESRDQHAPPPANLH